MFKMKNEKMKKNTLFLFLIVMACNASAQEYGYSRGDKLLNIGVGVNSYYSGGIPLSASFETGITDQISVGVGVDYLSNKYNVGSDASYKFTALYFGARASYHVNELLNINNKKVDLYGGATVGYRNFTWKDNYSNGSLSDSYGSGVFLGGFIGGKYYFTQRIGAFTELGAAGSTNGRLGVALKF